MDVVDNDQLHQKCMLAGLCSAILFLCLNSCVENVFIDLLDWDNVIAFRRFTSNSSQLELKYKQLLQDH